jgi:branched-subunit amino acid transport protein AzlD
MPITVIDSGLAIAVVALTTWFTRAVPYFIFGGKTELPDTVRYLGTVLPASIMVILVGYCLRDIDLTDFPFGLAEMLSVAVVIALQWFKKNTILSILIGTACYMILIRTVFAS